MRVRLQDGYREIEIVGRSHVVEFYSEELAVAYFRRLLKEPGNRTALRRALAEEMGGADVGRLDDESLLKRLARRMIHGDLRVVTRQLYPSGHNATPPEASQASTPRQDEQAAKAESAAAAAAATEEEAAETEEAAAEDAVLAGTEAAPQAATLQSAAATGAPLCET
jgi:hypothetical protein